MPYSAASYLDLYRLPRFFIWDAGLQWIKYEPEFIETNYMFYSRSTITFHRAALNFFLCFLYNLQLFFHAQRRHLRS